MSGLEFRCQHRYASGFDLDVSFTAPPLATALFGPSGSGKTSVLSMIGGFLRPQAGRIVLGAANRVLLDTEKGINARPEQRGIGFVFQDHLLFPHLSVTGNLHYGERRRSRPVSFERVVEVLELGNLLQRYPRQLSGGESQRVALGRALLSGPDLLLMDEPLAALDEALKQRVLGYLERVIGEWQIPTLFVTHSQQDVRQLAEWVVVLERGRVVRAGKVAEEMPE